MSASTAYDVIVGAVQDIEVARGEDRELQFTFTTDGSTPKDLTGAIAIILSVRNRATGLEVFARSYTGFVGAASAGIVTFDVISWDTISQDPGPYDVDIFWTDSSNNREQLLALSTFYILDSTLAFLTPVTTPPAVPVVYGLVHRGSWSGGVTGGYNLNDAVQALDYSRGSSAWSTFRNIQQGNTYYPIGP